MEQEFREALDKARRTELDGMDFYGKAAEKCRNETGKRLFLSLVEDEKRHLAVIKEIVLGMGASMEGQPMPRDTIRTIFSDALENVDDCVETSADEQEAIRIAMGMETASYQLYTSMAEGAGDPDTTALMERLAQEEQQHYEMLENTLEYLTSNEKWFLTSEWGLLTGDMGPPEG